MLQNLKTAISVPLSIFINFVACFYTSWDISDYYYGKMGKALPITDATSARLLAELSLALLVLHSIKYNSIYLCHGNLNPEVVLV